MEGILNAIDNIGLSVILTFLLVLLIVYFSYSTCEYDFWKKQGVPGETAWPFVGTMKPKYIFQRMELLDQENFKKYGKTFGGFEGQKAVLYTIDPDLIKQVWIKDFSTFTNRRVFEGFANHPIFGRMVSAMRNEEWKQTRAILTPTFTTGKIKQMFHTIEDCAKMLVISMDKVAETTEPINVLHSFSAFTLDVIASCAFGMKTNSIKNPDNEFTAHARNSFKPPPLIGYLVFTIPQLFFFFMKFMGRFAKDPFEYFADIASDVINKRQEQKSESQRKDFLDLLIEAEQEEESELGSMPANKKKILTRPTMVANCVIFLLAGHETTATTLSLLAYSLATNSDVQEKLIEEIDEAFTECKGNLTYEVAMKLPYLDMVVCETLRMYPPAVRTERACGVDGFKLGDIVMKKETLVIASIYSLHHSEEHYPNPEVFDPERFSTENKATRHPFAYMPFGVGPRNCLAMRFALTEVKLTMAHILSQFRFNTCDKTDFPLKMAPGGGLLNPKSITLQLQKRTDHPHFEI